VQNLPEYDSDKLSTNWHIKSHYSQEMSKPSIIVRYLVCKIEL